MTVLTQCISKGSLSCVVYWSLTAMFVPTYQLQDETDSAAVCGRWPEREGGLRQKTSTCTYVPMARHTITHHTKKMVWMLLLLLLPLAQQRWPLCEVLLCPSRWPLPQSGGTGRFRKHDLSWGEGQKQQRARRRCINLFHLPHLVFVKAAKNSLSNKLFVEDIPTHYPQVPWSYKANSSLYLFHGKISPELYIYIVVVHSTDFLCYATAA